MYAILILDLNSSKPFEWPQNSTSTRFNTPSNSIQELSWEMSAKNCSTFFHKATWNVSFSSLLRCDANIFFWEKREGKTRELLRCAWPNWKCSKRAEVNATVSMRWMQCLGCFVRVFRVATSRMCSDDHPECVNIVWIRMSLQATITFVFPGVK